MINVTSTHLFKIVNNNLQPFDLTHANVLNLQKIFTNERPKKKNVLTKNAKKLFDYMMPFLIIIIAIALRFDLTYQSWFYPFFRSSATTIVDRIEINNSTILFFIE